MKHNVLLELALACGVSLIAARASAADQKAYHGSICQTLHGDGAGPTVNGFYGGAQGARVWCPLIRDQMSSSTQIDQAQIELYNTYTFASDIRCWLYTQYEDAAGFTLDYTANTTSATGFVELNGFASGLDTTTGQEGSAAFECELGPQDYLLHFYVKEETLTE
jgi:hypothetical protein